MKQEKESKRKTKIIIIKNSTHDTLREQLTIEIVCEEKKNSIYMYKCVYVKERERESKNYRDTKE